MLPDMMASFLGGDAEEIWLTCYEGESIHGFCYATAEELTDGTWNMLAIAVHPSKQGGGYGGELVKHLEGMLTNEGHRVLIADTSGKDEFAPTRAFYRKNGYTEEARIRHFWAAGDDKVVFWKLIG